MKSKVKISDELIDALDEITGQKNNIEQVIEKLLRRYIKEEKRKQADLIDLQILNENSDYLNSEAEDVLTYQINL